MKVTFVVNALGEGGTERSLADLVFGLRDAGVELDIVTLRSRGEEGVEPILRASGFDVHTIGQGGPARTLRALRRHLRAHRPDIVHTMLFEANLYGRIAAIGTGARTVVSLVNTTYSDERLADPRLSRWKVRAVQLLDATLARLITTRFHAVSQAVKHDAVSGLRLPENKITVIERGRRAETLPAPSPARRAAAREKLNVSPDTSVLVAVGRHEYQKGHRYLFEAIRELSDRTDLVLLVAGRTGNETDALDRMLASIPNAAERIRLLGHRSDVTEVLAAADVFVLASLFEGMPGAVIEAMSAGLPIVASDIDPVREVVDTPANAILVPPRDPAALATAIRTLLDDPERRIVMGARSREIFDQRFTIERSVAGFVELYQQVAKAP